MSPPPSSNLPRPPSPPPANNFNQRLWMAVVGGVAAVVLGVVIASQVANRGDDVVSIEATPTSIQGELDQIVPPTDPSTAPETTDPGPTEPGTTEPPDTASPSTTVDPAQADVEFDALIDEISRFVEQERGLTFKEDPVVVVLDDDEFLAQYNELVEQDLAENAADYENFTGIFHALGLLRPSVTLEEANAALAAGGIGGYYDPETKELYVRGGSTTPLVRQIIAHELTHALDDQWFDLNRPELDERDDEAGFGFRGVVEGNARRVENAYERTFSAAELAEARAEGIELSRGLDLTKVTFPYLEIQLAPYEDGVSLVDTLLAEGGQEALDAAIENPPLTSEQILFPDTLGQERIEIDPPPADGEVVEQGVVGSAVIRSILTEPIGSIAARDAAEGWGGDWFVSWTDGDRTCVRMDFVGDTPADTAQIADGFAEWVQNQSDAEVEQSDTIVRVRSCA